MVVESVKEAKLQEKGLRWKSSISGQWLWTKPFAKIGKKTGRLSLPMAVGKPAAWRQRFQQGVENFGLSETPISR
jgi:hypothetical protein